MNSDFKSSPGGSSVLHVRALSKTYRRRRVPWRRPDVIAAAVDIELEVSAGQTVALIGASGSGKSTVARCVTRLEKPDTGEIWLEDREVSQLGHVELQAFRSQVQLVFQDAVTSMNPRMTAAEVIGEPLHIQKQGDRTARRSRAEELMKEVGVSPLWADRRAMDFSGGQRQRLAIARALALRPKLLVLDEALTGLDLSTEAQIANLLLDLQAAHSLAFLLISHDLALVSCLANTLVVMAGGRIVESGPASEVIGSPTHPETQALVACANAARSGLATALGTSQ